MSSFYTFVPKIMIIMMYNSWDMECNRHIFFSFLAIFLPFTPLFSPKIKIVEVKNVENTWRYYPFTHEYHKWRSYDIWFLRHKTEQTKFLSFWAISCPLILLITWKSNEKRDLEVLSFYTLHHIWQQSYDVWFLRYGVATEFFCIHSSN